jgi:GRASP55/65 PDZ-like domain
VVFNIKSQEARVVHLTPNDTWGGAGLLGVTIRMDNYAGAEDRFIRVLSVVESGPAAVSGLLNDGTDFILGTTHHTINSLSHFAQLLRDNAARVIELYVYNANTDIVRVVTLMPSYEWNVKSGGSGLFGAEVGTGYLHRLPYRSRSTSGKCVERKVRYVPINTKEENVVLIEDAPQMEMEPPDPEDDDDENIEEVYNEPNAVSNAQVKISDQLSGSGTAESAPIKITSTEPITTSQANEPVLQSSTVSSEVPATLHPPLHHQAQVHSNAAAAAIFGQPLVPQPLHQQSQIPFTAVAATSAATSKSSELSPLGPPPPAYYGVSSIAPQVLSYAPPTTIQAVSASSSSFATAPNTYAYAVPTATTMPPPPRGGVWNHATSSKQ